MFLVIWGHAIQHFMYGMQGFNNDVVWRGIQSVHMPLFMVMAGYFAKKSMTLEFVAIVKKKFHSLLLPCITWGIVAFVGLHFTLGNNLSLPLTLVDNFWFLKSLFVCYLIGWLFFRIKGLNLRYSTILGGGIALVISLLVVKYDVSRMFPCFMMGMLINHFNLPKSNKKQELLLASGFLFIILSFYWSNHHELWTGPYTLLQYICGEGTFSAILFNYVYKIAIGVSGSIMFILLFQKLFDHRENKCLKFIASIGTCTLGIYIVQTYFLERLLARLVHLSGNYVVNMFVVTPIASIIVLLICYYCVVLLSKNKYVSMLFLGK
jgi:fucose 4-O-acetylase-like acetyltransferase